MHPNHASIRAARVGMVGAVVFMVVGFVLWFTARDSLWGLILVCIGIANFGACRREIQIAQHSAGPYMGSESLEAWQTDPEAWKAGSGSSWSRASKEGPGFWERRRSQGAEKRARREAVDAQARDAEIDRILERVNEVGMDGLTKKEREFLVRASKERRGE
jgi:hypothetical protein